MKTKLLFSLSFILLICACSRRNYICDIDRNSVLNDLYIKNNELNNLIVPLSNDSLKDIFAAICIIDSFDLFFKNKISQYDKGCIDESLTYTYLYILEDYGPELIRKINSYIASHPENNSQIFIELYDFYNSDWLISIATNLPIDALLQLQILKMNLLQFVYYNQTKR